MRRSRRAENTLNEETLLRLHREITLQRSMARTATLSLNISSFVARKARRRAEEQGSVLNRRAQRGP